MKKINENTKVTLTVGQLKRLVRESDDNGDDPRLQELKKTIRKIIGFSPNNVTISNNGFTCGTVQFKVDSSLPYPWRAISVGKPVTIKGELDGQFPAYLIGCFMTTDKASLQRIVDLFK